MRPGLITSRDAALRAPRKKEDLFMKKYPFPEKCLSLKKISARFCAKNFVLSPLGLNHSCLSTSFSAAKNYDGW